MDQNNGLEANTFKEETRTTITMDLREIPLLFIRVSLQDQTSHMGTTIRTMEDHMINVQISHSIEAMEIDLGMNLLIIRVGPGETMETSLVLYRLKGETSHKIVHTANQGVVSLTILVSADLTIDLGWVLRLTNKIFPKTITRRHLILFVSPQPTKPFMNYQTPVR